MLKKKAQGMSIKIIIVAVIGLIILVIVIALLTGKLGIFTVEVENVGNPAKNCIDQDGTVDKGKTNCLSGVEVISKDTLPGSGDVCCRK